MFYGNMTFQQVNFVHPLAVKAGVSDVAFTIPTVDAEFYAEQLYGERWFEIQQWSWKKSPKHCIE